MNHPRPSPATARTDPDPRRQFFDAQAPQWDGDTAESLARLDRLRHLASDLGIHSGQAILEVGCGTGQFTGWLIDTVRPARVLSLDFSPGMLAIARAKHPHADLRCLDICAESPPARAFDLAFCFQCFPHFRDRPAALRHLAAALKDRGRLVILHFLSRDEINTLHRQVGGDVGHDSMPAEDEWPGLLAPAGFHRHRLRDEPRLFLLEASRTP